MVDRRGTRQRGSRTPPMLGVHGDECKSAEGSDTRRRLPRLRRRRVRGRAGSPGRAIRERAHRASASSDIRAGNTESQRPSDRAPLVGTTSERGVAAEQARRRPDPTARPRDPPARAALADEPGVDAVRASAGPYRREDCQAQSLPAISTPRIGDLGMIARRRVQRATRCRRGALVVLEASGNDDRQGIAPCPVPGR